MAADFIGLTVLVTLKDNLKLRGLVADVRGSGLVLNNIFVSQTGERLPTAQLPSSQIADIEVAPPSSQFSSPVSATFSQAQNHAIATGRPSSRPNLALTPSQLPPSKKSFVDPAILSFGQIPPRTNVQNTPMVELAGTHTPAPQSSATLSAPFSGVAINNENGTFKGESVQTIENDPAQVEKPIRIEDLVPAVAKKAGRKDKKVVSQKKEVFSQQSSNVDSSPEVARTNSLRSNGWRQTPIIAEPHSKAKESPARNPPGIIGGMAGRLAVAAETKSRKSKSKKQRQQETNGWATEEATDVQELGDFDFEANLNKFDKRAVFEQLRIDDTTADEDRLVSFNRARPGTFGGKNLHPSENVLAANVGELEISDFDNVSKEIKNAKGEKHNGRRSSSNAGSPFDLSRSRTFGKYASSHTTSSPRLRGTSATSPRFRSVNDQPCPVVEPEKLTVIEGIACSEFFLNDDIMDENAARGIAEVALSAIFNSSRSRSAQRKIAETTSVIVILVGDHKAGARAIAAARHLLERGVRVVIVLQDYLGNLIHYTATRPRLSSQLRRLGGGKNLLFSWEEASKYLKTLNTPPDLIIDALIGALASTTLPTSPRSHDLWTQDAIEMAAWANRSKAGVLAVDLPSGIDPLTGDVKVVDGEPAEVRAKLIVACGAPYIGLLKAMARGAEGEVFIGDTGINRAWRRFVRSTDGKKAGRGVEFGEQWIMGLRFEGGNA